MYTLTRPSKKFKANFQPTRPKRQRRFSPLALIGVLVTVIITLIAGAFLATRPYAGSYAAEAAVNGDCTLIVPPQPLTAKGLATPYQLVATNPKNGPCHETNSNQAAFAQGAVIDPATGNISIYNPLVIDKGSKPAVSPVVPMLPQGAVVALWFGSNGNTLTLRNSHHSLRDGHCVNGIKGSIFGQFSYCNAPAFFQAANKAIQAGKLKVPALGTGTKDGLPCPSTRDFSIVDQDQSDNVTTSYIITAKGKIAQDSQANAAALGGQGQVQKNGSDERLLTLVDAAIGCKPWMAPDLADRNHMVAALPLNELQAAADQKSPIALVPSLDPMVLVNNKTNQYKLNMYRVGVDQLPVQSLATASTKTYCTNLLAVAPQRLLLDQPFTQQAASPDPAVANNLFTFLTQRFVATYVNLNCQEFVHQQNPITVKTANGAAIDARINVPNH